MITINVRIPSSFAKFGYRSESYFQDTLLIRPCKLDRGIHAADGLDNSFQIDQVIRVGNAFEPKQ